MNAIEKTTLGEVLYKMKYIDKNGDKQKTYVSRKDLDDLEEWTNKEKDSAKNSPGRMSPVTDESLKAYEIQNILEVVPIAPGDFEGIDRVLEELRVLIEFENRLTILGRSNAESLKISLAELSEIQSYLNTLRRLTNIAYKEISKCSKYREIYEIVAMNEIN